MLEYILGFTKQGNKEITNRGKRDYKQGELKDFQVGAGISNCGKETPHRGRDCKLVQERLQIGAGITNRC